MEWSERMGGRNGVEPSGKHVYAMRRRMFHAARCRNGSPVRDVRPIEAQVSRVYFFSLVRSLFVYCIYCIYMDIYFDAANVCVCCMVMLNIFRMGGGGGAERAQNVGARRARDARDAMRARGTATSGIWNMCFDSEVLSSKQRALTVCTRAQRERGHDGGL